MRLLILIVFTYQYGKIKLNSQINHLTKLIGLNINCNLAKCIKKFTTFISFFYLSLKIKFSSFILHDSFIVVFIGWPLNLEF